MVCPKCGGDVRAIDTIQAKDNETFRCRKCLNCGHKIYTVEFEVEPNRQFKKEWNFYLRERQSAYID